MRSVVLPLSCVGVFLSLTCLAQTPPDSAAATANRAGAVQQQLQQQREEAQQRERAVNAPSVRLQVTAEAIPDTLPPESPCFPLKRIELVVPTSLPESVRALNDPTTRFDRFAFARKWLDRYAGQCAGQHGIELLRKGVLAQILSRGYVTTRVLLRDQDLSKGVLRFELLPGTVHDIRFADPKTRGTLKSAFPNSPGDLLNLRDLEQGLEQMKRPSSQDADMKIEAAKQFGESDIVVSVQRAKPWKFVLGVDNSGTHETGKVQGSATLGIDNPLGLNDLFSVGVSNDLLFTDKNMGTHGANAYYSVPWGNWTFSLSGNTSNYFQHVAAPNQTFISSGVTRTVSLRADRVLYRDQFSKTSAEVQLTRRFGRTFIEDAEIGNQHRNNTFFEIGLLRRQYLGNAQLDATLAYRQGVSWLGAQGELRDPFTGELSDQTYLYKMGVLDASLSLPFKIGTVPFRYLSTFHGQMTPDHLYYIDDLSIGSFYSVRGFDGEYLLSAEKGFYWRNDLELPLGNSGQAAYLGLDYGHVWGPSVAALLGNQLAGVALGIRGGKSGIAGALSYDLFIGTPLYAPAHYPTARATVGFQLTYQY
ncbi:hypothetical protein WJ39_08305 [Burkholderia diffusa]|nr:hypothetical protein WJ39_08305 [Burkholderia diffusa]